jgi:hypothetical protein
MQCVCCSQLMQQLRSSPRQMEVAPLLAACHLSRPGAPWRQCTWRGMIVARQIRLHCKGGAWGGCAGLLLEMVHGLLAICCAAKHTCVSSCWQCGRHVLCLTFVAFLVAIECRTTGYCNQSHQNCTISYQGRRKPLCMSASVSMTTGLLLPEIIIIIMLPIKP